MEWINACLSSSSVASLLFRTCLMIICWETSLLTLAMTSIIRCRPLVQCTELSTQRFFRNWSAKSFRSESKRRVTFPCNILTHFVRSTAAKMINYSVKKCISGYFLFLLSLRYQVTKFLLLSSYLWTHFIKDSMFFCKSFNAKRSSGLCRTYTKQFSFCRYEQRKAILSLYSWKQFSYHDNGQNVFHQFHNFSTFWFCLFPVIY